MDHNYLDKNGLTHLWSKIVAQLNLKAAVNHTHSYNDLSNKPTIPPDVSNQVETNTNDIYQQGVDIYEIQQDVADLYTNKADASELSKYYNKTESDAKFYSVDGGNIGGNVDIDGILELNVEDEDYDCSVKFTPRLDTNRGFIMNMRGHADETAYYTVLEGIGTPVSSHDAATKQYVDDLCSVTFITGFYEQGELIVASDAYQKCFEGVTGNHSTYLKITEAGQVSVMRLQSWINFNAHSTHEDSFQFVGLTDEDTTKTAVITYTGASFSTCDFEHVGRKVNSWQTTPDDVHYPTEKLVKDNFDALRAYIDDKLGEHIVWTGSLKATENKARNPNWHITGLDLSPYRYILCYIQPCKGTNNDQEGSGHVVRVDLQNGMLSPRSNMYIGGLMTPYPQDNGVKYGSSVVVSQDKTSINFHYNFANTTGTTCLDRDAVMWKVTGVKGIELNS